MVNRFQGGGPSCLGRFIALQNFIVRSEYPLDLRPSWDGQLAQHGYFRSRFDCLHLVNLPLINWKLFLYSSRIRPTRIAAGIVTGISFIGAGSIIASKGDVKGVTTAASLWVIASIGLMVGFGIYLLPIIATIIVYLILHFGRIEKKRIHSNNIKN